MARPSGGTNVRNAKSPHEVGPYFPAASPFPFDRSRRHSFSLLLPMRTNQELDHLERSLKELRIEYEKYFNGANDLPPGDLRSAIDRRLRTLRHNVKGSADNFRLGSLEARFNSYNEMFNRRVRDLEEGRTRTRRSSIPMREPDAYDGVLVASAIDEGAAAALYKGLYEGSPKIDLGTFQGYLDRQAEAIRKKTGCAQVQFRLSDEGGKTKLKAKAVK